MIRGMEQLCCENRLRELGLINLERRGLQLDLIQAFLYLIRTTRKKRTNICRVCCGRTKGNGFNLKENQFRLDTRMKFFIIRVMKH